MLALCCINCYFFLSITPRPLYCRRMVYVIDKMKMTMMTNVLYLGSIYLQKKMDCSVTTSHKFSSLPESFQFFFGME